jgi:ABC-2 type transport system permease protein
VTGLVVSEFRRFLSRGLFRLLLLVAVAVVVFVCLMVFLRTHHPVYVSEMEIGFAVAAGLLFTLSVVIGASFVGADWATGSLSTLLTWEPRRVRVFVAKLIAAVVTTAIVTLVLLVLEMLLLAPAAAAHGTMGFIPWWTAVGVWLRIGALAAIGAALGLGLASVMRSAAGPVATWLIFQFVATPALVLWKRWLVRWLPEGLIRDFTGIERIFRAPVSGAFTLGGNVVRGGLILSAYALAMLVAGYWSFAARDVT